MRSQDFDFLAERGGQPQLIVKRLSEEQKCFPPAGQSTIAVLTPKTPEVDTIIVSLLQPTTAPSEAESSPRPHSQEAAPQYSNPGPGPPEVHSPSWPGLCLLSPVVRRAGRLSPALVLPGRQSSAPHPQASAGAGSGTQGSLLGLERLPR